MNHWYKIPLEGWSEDLADWAPVTSSQRRGELAAGVGQEMSNDLDPSRPDVDVTWTWQSWTDGVFKWVRREGR